MIYAAAKAQGASDLEAYSAARSVDDAIHVPEDDVPEAYLIEPQTAPVEIDLEYDEETLTLLVRDRRLPANPSAAGVRH